MKRREFIQLAAGTAVSWPLVAQAQQQAMPVIGYADGVSITTLPTASLLAGVRRALAASGFVEGKNFQFEFREAKGELGRLPALYRELADQKVKVLLAPTTTQLEAARSVTQTIPIIFQTGIDPVENGFVTSISRPGGNLTGVFNLAELMTGKRVEVLREIVPSLTKFAFLTFRQDVRLSQKEAKAAQDTADLVRLDLLVLSASNVEELEAAFETSVREGAGGMIVGSNARLYSLTKPLAALAARYRLPVIHIWPVAAREGVLVSYGADQEENFELVGSFVARILKGEMVADIPVQQSTKTKMLINLKTAKTLEITIPTSLLGRADEVIE
jgi:putative tryptophan/tyrosine transport system substrate-binding protein